MSFSHEEYRVKESDGFVLIKAVVSGYRKFSIKVVAKSFVPTKFNIPAGWLSMIVDAYHYLQFMIQQIARTSRLEHTNYISQWIITKLPSKSQYTMTTLLRALKHLQSVCTYQNTTGTDMWIMATPSLLKSSSMMVSTTTYISCLRYIYEHMQKQ